MKLEDLRKLESKLMEVLVRRRQLGGYNADAETILVLTEALFRLTEHAIEQMPPERKKK